MQEILHNIYIYIYIYTYKRQDYQYIFCHQWMISDETIAAWADFTFI